MYTEGFEQWLKLGKNVAAPFGDFGKTATEIGRRAMEQHLELLGENFSRYSDQLRRLSNVRKPEELLQLQKECLSENVTATIENTQKLLRLSMENVSELTKAFSSLREPVMAATQKVAEKAKKYAERSEEYAK